MDKDKKYFENKFKDFKSAPPLTVWKDIESGLIQKERRKKGYFFMRIAAGLLLLITALWFSLSNSGIKENKLTKVENSKIENANERLNEDIKPEIRNAIASIDSENQMKLNWPGEENSSEVIIDTKKETKTNTSDEAKIKKTKHGDFEDLNLADSIKNNKHPIKIIQPELESKSTLLAKLGKDSLLQEKHYSDQILLADADLDNNSEKTSDKKDEAKSITIILRPKSRDNLASNDNSNDEKSKFEQFKESLNKDLYKQTIRLGEVPDLAFNKLKLRSN